MVPEYFKAAYLEITEFVKRALDALDLDAIERFTGLLVRAYEERKRVLVVGVGRSGLVGRGFAMRLRHIGLESYVLGETITPSVGIGDIVVAISGSGTTQIVVSVAEAAKKVGATLVAITSYPDSPLGKLADLVIKVPGRTKLSEMTDYFARQILGLHEPLSPLGTLFEITAMVTLDALAVELMKKLGKTENDLKLVHANIEVP